MKIKPLSIPGCYEIDLASFLDNRGTFLRAFDKSALQEFGVNIDVSQVNLSTNTVAGTIRGLHVQATPYSEFKLVQCISGSVFDVVVDLRRKSHFFGSWCNVKLVPFKNAILIAPGVAHGFQTLVPDTSLLYLHSKSYKPAHARGIRFDDRDLDIPWPLAPKNVSNADLNLPSILESEFWL